jgi:K+-sensing histidine kinase KdpD
MKDKDILDISANTYMLYQLSPSIIHEFNNIFTAIISTTQLMIEYEDDMDSMIEGFKNIQKYVEKAVSFNRFVSTYILDKNSKDLSVNKFFDIIKNSLEKELKSNNTNLVIKMDDYVKDVKINASVVKSIVQLILNAQDEALKSDIVLSAYLNDGNLIIDTISDGNEIQSPNEIFTLGYTNKNNRPINDRYKREHFGVGLPLARYIVNSLKGEITYHHENNKNIFRINLPQ